MTRFEDLIAWRRARALTSAIYAATREGDAARDFRFTSQLRSAAVSVMSNVAEGFERESGPQFVQFLQIARASAGEVRSLLYVALDLGYVDAGTYDRLLSQCLNVTRLVTALRNSISHRSADSRSPRSVGEDSEGYDVGIAEDPALPAWLLEPAVTSISRTHGHPSSEHGARST